MVWRELYPVGIHYLIGQILGSAVLLWLVNHVSNAQESYYSYTLVITGLTGVLVMFPAVYFYRKDCIGRALKNFHFFLSGSFSFIFFQFFFRKSTKNLWLTP